jgi:hypothetical protein
MATPSPKRVRAPEQVLVRRVGGEAVLLDLASEECFGLDDVATAMWEALNSSASVEEAYEMLLEDFEVDDVTLRRDLNALINQLIEARLLEAED